MNDFPVRRSPIPRAGRDPDRNISPIAWLADAGQPARGHGSVRTRLIAGSGGDSPLRSRDPKHDVRLTGRKACHGAVGARVIAHDPGIDPAKAAEMGVEWVPLEALLARAEMISLHCDLDEKTRGIVGEAAFAAMGDGTYLVNTARGPLVDTPALLGALDSGRVAAAALDVFPIEPLPPGDPVVAHPRIVATPHISAFTEEAIHRETAWVLEDIVNILDGQDARHR